MKEEAPSDLEIHSEVFLHQIMRRQLRLSLFCASLFLVTLLALPLMNYFLPDLMSRSIGGFTLSWFILGIFFFPVVWLIAWFFIKRSISFEKHAVEIIKRKK